MMISYMIPDTIKKYVTKIMKNTVIGPGRMEKFMHENVAIFRHCRDHSWTDWDTLIPV